MGTTLLRTSLILNSQLYPKRNCPGGNERCKFEEYLYPIFSRPEMACKFLLFALNILYRSYLQFLLGTRLESYLSLRGFCTMNPYIKRHRKKENHKVLFQSCIPRKFFNSRTRSSFVKEKRSTFGAIFLHFTPRWPYLHKTSIMNCAAILKTAHSTLYFIHQNKYST